MKNSINAEKIKFDIKKSGKIKRVNSYRLLRISASLSSVIQITAFDFFPVPRYIKAVDKALC